MCASRQTKSRFKYDISYVIFAIRSKQYFVVMQWCDIFLQHCFCRWSHFVDDTTVEMPQKKCQHESRIVKHGTRTRSVKTSARTDEWGDGKKECCGKTNEWKSLDAYNTSSAMSCRVNCLCNIYVLHWTLVSLLVLYDVCAHVRCWEHRKKRIEIVSYLLRMGNSRCTSSCHWFHIILRAVQLSSNRTFTIYFLCVCLLSPFTLLLFFFSLLRSHTVILFRFDASVYFQCFCYFCYS